MSKKEKPRFETENARNTLIKIMRETPFPISQYSIPLKLGFTIFIIHLSMIIYFLFARFNYLPNDSNTWLLLLLSGAVTLITGILSFIQRRIEKLKYFGELLEEAKKEMEKDEQEK